MIDFLSLKNVSVKSKNKIRLNNINLKVSEGENIVLIGRSGSGKTSLINVCNGSLRADEGEVKFMGDDITSISRKKQSKIGTLWQDIRLINEL